jgi:hypothetical protein
MNEPSISPPPIPSSPAFGKSPEMPLGANPVEQKPITGLISALECILRQPRRVMFQLRQPGAGNLVIALVIIAVVSAAIYGVVVGTFSGDVQLWAAPVKIAGGLLLSALICLPSLYIFACLSGAEVRLGEVAGLLAGLLALMAVLLIGFAPVAWVFAQSTESLVAMGALHLVFGLIAVSFGLRFLDTAFNHFSARAPGGRRLWMILFLLVMLQMTTALRPMVGTAETFLPTEKRFFLSHWAQCLR